MNTQQAKKSVSLILSAALVLTALTMTGCGKKPPAKNADGTLPAEDGADNLSITAKPEPAVILNQEGRTFDYIITDDWDTGFTADITITNETTEYIQGWTLSFNGNFTVTETSNAKLISSDGASHVVVNELWTKTINPIRLHTLQEI
jgi:predicted small lipoprotein YifL